VCISQILKNALFFSFSCCTRSSWT
jgi:hypothetical protein